MGAIRQISVTEQTYYRWKKNFGGLGTEQHREVKLLQKENERIRRAVSDLTLDKLILSEAARGNLLAPRVGTAVLRYAPCAETPKR